MNSFPVGLKEREQLYRLIISQLFYDGHQAMAVGLSNQVKAHPACPPSDRLLTVISKSLALEDADTGDMKGETVMPGSGIDLEFETDGQLIATGSEDFSIKILDVERMLAKSVTPVQMLAQETPQQQMENHPVIRTLYDHSAEVTALAFHPEQQILVSGAKDFSVKFFEFSKPSVKKASKSIQEAAEVQSLSFHPSGEYLLVATEHPTLRLYDCNTLQCFVASNPGEQHRDAVRAVDYSPNANLYVSASKDGDFKLWDGVSNRCINTFGNAHDGSEVCSVFFSRNSKYVLSSGMDSLVKLWELSTARCLIAYTGAGTTGRQQHRTQAVFNHTEDYVLFPDEKTTSLCCWDSRNADRQRLLALGHNGLINSIVHSPTGPAFITCSDDFRARFWYRKAEMD